MIKKMVLLGVIIFIATSISVSKQATERLCPVHVEVPLYVALARQTRIEGDVEIEFQIDRTGKINSARAISGPSILAREAERNIRTWTFTGADQGSYRIVYEFHLENPEVYFDPPPRVSFDFPNRVRIVSDFKPINP